ncbi:MAG: DUF4260 domain-containing protein [Salegentibacter sp.]
MNLTLRLEETAMFLLGVLAFYFLDYSWWWFLLLFFTPDLGMIGYIFGDKIGAFSYNFLHHKGLAVMPWLGGFWLKVPLLQLIGVILFSHSAFDRILGYGLKYGRGFKFTHLGEIGK